MSFLERFLTQGNLRDAKMASMYGKNLTTQNTEINPIEAKVLRAYMFAYFAVQNSGEFYDYQKLPYWKWLKIIPPIPSVVGAAINTTRIGQELLNETADYEYLLRLRGDISGRELRNLANLLSSSMQAHCEERVTNVEFLQAKEQLKSIIIKWKDREKGK